jgi:hypothetical protein
LGGAFLSISVPAAPHHESRNKTAKSCVCPKRQSDAWEHTMRTSLCYVAAFGLAVVAGHGTANAQTVITREVVSPPVDAVVPQPQMETVITRRPLATVPAPTMVEQPYETVETIQTTRPARTVTRRVTTSTRRVSGSRKPARTVRRSITRTTRTATLTPEQQRTIYRVIRRDRIVPTQTVTERVVTAPAYPPPAYVAPGPGYEPATAAVVPPPPYRYDQWNDSDSYYETDRYPDQVTVPPAAVVNPTPPVVVERIVMPPAGIAVGEQLPATVPVYAMPSAAIARVPNASGYHYAYVNGQILLVDPNTNVVLAALQQ